MAISGSSETLHLLQPFMEHNISPHEHIPEVRVEVLFVCIEKRMKMVGSVMLSTWMSDRLWVDKQLIIMN